jgi:signal-transduction protein with cAMP-binding, CBS, and nucleotidyltransferase domain/tellurite resistance protein
MEDGDGFTDGRARGALDREMYLAAVVRLAAADGSVDAEERVISEVASDLGLGPAARAAARRRALDRAVGTEVLVGGVRDDDLRVGLLFDAYRVAAADGHVGPAELEELGRVAMILGVHPVGAASVRPPASVHGPHAFLRHDGDGHSRLDSSEFAAEIAATADVPALAARARDIGALGRDLVDAGVSASQVTRTVSALADAVSERAICLVLEGEDLAGLDVCWLAFGSEGRREQTLCTDQDNGLAFEPGQGAAVEPVRARLVALARKVNDALAACGFPHCKGGVMAGNPAWCLTTDEWREQFRSWVDAPTPQALLNASIFFDFRPIFGNEALAGAMREQLARSAPGNRRFLSQLVQNALARRPPLGFFRDFAVEAGGPHAGTVDLKTGAAALFVDAARIYALAGGEGAPGTEDRLRSAAAAAGVDRREVEGWVEAFHFVQVLRLRHQLEQDRSGEVPHNRIDPYALNPLERKFFRETLRLAASIQKRMERAFCGEATRV